MPTGTVTISGTPCLIKLSGGKGTCTAKAGTFHVGNHSLVAHYWGDGNFNGSTIVKEHSERSQLEASATERGRASARPLSLPNVHPESPPV